MSAIFISHSSKDNDEAERFASWLEKQGYGSIFLDVNPDDGLIAGSDWERALYAKLRSCRAVIILCSERSMASDWCFAEATHARSLGKDVFPVRIAPCELRSILRGYQCVDLTKDLEEGHQRLLKGLRAVLGSRDLTVRETGRSPYPGLLSFTELDAPVFFGRDSEIRDGIAWINRLNRFGGAPAGLVLGVSGCGKSSFVRAGLVPQLRIDTRSWLVVEPFRPLEDPWAELAHALAQTCQKAGVAFDHDGLRREFEAARNAEESNPDASVLTNQLNKLRQETDRRAAKALLVIDQLEELFKNDPQHPASRFAGYLKAALSLAKDALMFLGTLRSDLLGEYQSHPVFGVLATADFTVRPLTLHGFARVIEGPAQVAGLELEAGLVQDMVADTETEDALPLLAFTLRELWERCGGDGRFSLNDYRVTLGGLEGSLARAADAVMSGRRLDDRGYEALRTAFLALVRIDEEGRYVRRPARWIDLPEAAHEALARLETARLIVPRVRGEERTVEVAHEALFRAWQQLRDWLREDVSLLQVHATVRRAALDWQRKDRDPNLLVHRGSRLEDAEGLNKNPRITPSTLETEYIEACVAARTRAEAEKEVQRKRVEGEFYASCILLAQQYIEGSQYTIAQEWLMQCPEDIRNWEWGYLMRLAALELPAMSVAELPGSMIDGGPAPPPTSFDMHEWFWTELEGFSVPTYVQTRDAWAESVLSRDGRLGIMRGARDKEGLFTPQIFEAESGKVLFELAVHSKKVRNACFSDDGSLLVIARGQTATIHEADTGRVVSTLRGHMDEIWGVAFSPDATRIVTVADDGSAKVWDVANGRALVNLRKSAEWHRLTSPSPTGGFSLYRKRGDGFWRTPQFSPDGRSIAISVEGAAYVWMACPFRPEQLPDETVGDWSTRFQDWKTEWNERALERFERNGEKRSAELHKPRFERPIRVATVEEFMRAIGPDRVIELVGPGPFDLGDEDLEDTEYVRWDPAQDGRTMTIHGVKDLTILARAEDKVAIHTPAGYAFVLQFERCKRIVLEHLTLGHAPELGGCDRGVVGVIDSSHVNLLGCDLFGCGTEGLTMVNVTDCLIEGVTIRDCTYGMMSLTHCNRLFFRQTSLVNNQEYWGINFKHTRDVLLLGCSIEGNTSSDPLLKVDESQNIKFAGGRITGNKAPALISDPEGIRFHDVVIEGNDLEVE